MSESKMLLPGMAVDAAIDRNMPMVSIVVPVRNEADFIEPCLRALLSSDYPRDRLEILLVDGMSDDRTAAIAEIIAREDPRLRILLNHHRVVPHAMNQAIREAKGEIVIRVDGHALVTPNFVRRNVETLRRRPEAWCVGGPVKTVSRSFLGSAIAAAMTSPAGVGNARFRTGNYEGHVDTIAFGAYWRWVFGRIGLFDEELVRNQDDELNLRLIKAGGKIYMSPDICSEYYARTSLRKLARQYYQYGFWRIRTIQKHRQPATLRQIIPLLFVITWLILILGALTWSPLQWLLGAAAIGYTALLALGGVDVARRFGLPEAILAPVVFAILHFSYGLGSLHGLVHFVLLRRKPIRPEDQSMSR